MKTKVGRLSDKHPNIREGYEWTGLCDCGFFTMGWPTKKQARLRINQHLDEHDGELMPHISEVEQLTPDKFTSNVANTVDRNPLWDEVQ